MVMIVMSTAYAVVELILLVANVIHVPEVVSTFLRVKVNIISIPTHTTAFNTTFINLEVMVHIFFIFQLVIVIP